MKILMLLSLLCRVAFPVKHSLTYILSSSYGIRSVPEFVAVALVDGVQMAHCDTSNLTPIAKTDWMERFFKDKKERLEWYTNRCRGNQDEFKDTIESLMLRLNQTGGVHIFQRMNGCEWDDETGDISGFNQYGYDGEDFLTFDPKTLTWIAPKPQAVIMKHELERNIYGSEFWKAALYHKCIDNLKEYVDYGKSSLQRTDLPSVSLLQKSPSSPVSCHATGFYPDRAVMFWREDGEELHEDVDHGEILPNQDGTFQMSVDLKVSSVTPEDWSRYDCVFHLSGVKDDIVTKLDKAVIRINWEKPSYMTISIIVVLVLVLIIAVTGSIVCKANCPPSSPDNGYEPPERLTDTE